MLRTLPLDAIKIDRSFITPVTASKSAREMAAKIVEIARLLNLEVIAEGVEKAAELNLLREIECDLVQGFLISRALPLQQLNEFLSSHRKAATAGVVALHRR
jgi:EAL domain-containing protein (putative c-di-GMP-specific phosphodiesterase class I)